MAFHTYYRPECTGDRRKVRQESRVQSAMLDIKTQFILREIISAYKRNLTRNSRMNNPPRALFTSQFQGHCDITWSVLRARCMHNQSEWSMGNLCETMLKMCFLKKTSLNCCIETCLQDFLPLAEENRLSICRRFLYHEQRSQCNGIFLWFAVRSNTSWTTELGLFY